MDLSRVVQRKRAGPINGFKGTTASADEQRAVSAEAFLLKWLDFRAKESIQWASRKKNDQVSFFSFFSEQC